MSASKQTPRRWRWVGWVVVLIAALGAVGFVTMRRAARAANSVVAETGEVSLITAIHSVETSGTLEAQQSASLFWKTTGTVATVDAQAGQPARAGEVLMTLDPASVPQNIILAQADLISAQTALDDLLHPTDLAIANAQKAVADAQDTLDKARRDLGYVENPAGQSLYDAVDDAQLALDTAQANQQLANVSADAQALASAKVATDQAFRRFQDLKARYDASNGDTMLYNAMQSAEAAYQAALSQQQTLELRIGTDKANKDSAVTKAQAQYDDAVANLNAALRGPDANRLAITRAKVAVAEAALADAQVKLDRLIHGADPDDIASATARVQAAQATVNQLSLRAPFDGEVLAVDAQPGDTASQSQAAVVLADRSRLHVDASVDEADVNQIHLGDPVTVTFDSLPDLSLHGSVGWIQPYGETVQGLVKYTVRVDLDEADPRLLLGMTANIQIVTQVTEGALAVPLDAVQLDGRGEFVNRIGPDGNPQRVDVVSGEVQDDLVVVTGDLKPGDRVQLVKTLPAQRMGPFGG